MVFKGNLGGKMTGFVETGVDAQQHILPFSESGANDGNC